MYINGRILLNMLHILGSLGGPGGMSCEMFSGGFSGITLTRISAHILDNLVSIESNNTIVHCREKLEIPTLFWFTTLGSVDFV